MISKISKNNNLLSFKGQSVITPWDRLKKFIFSPYPIVYVDQKTTDTDLLIEHVADYTGKTDMVWVVVNGTTLNPNFPWHYKPSDVGHNVIHKFPKVIKRTGRPVNWGDIQLVPTGGVIHGTVKNKVIGSYHEADFDIVMISFHEAEADANYQKLKLRFPDAIHVKNIEGIGNAHKKAGEMAKSEMVYIVDADADIHDDFCFDYIPPMAKRANTTYVWYAKNPVNDLKYGYGGVKLFPRQQIMEMGHVLPDFSTGSAFYQPVRDVSNTTRFNRDPFRTWRSAFRECVKLASQINPNAPVKETEDRLKTWCEVDNGERFGRYCIKGANEGKAYGEANKDDVEALNKINDFEWLREQFVESMKKRISAN
jgi:hypothetical protein